MLVLDITTFCTDSAAIWYFVGWILMIFKIVIPLLLIIMGSIDFGKAVIGGDSDKTKESLQSLSFRAIAAVIIFLIPTLVGLVFGWIMDFSNTDLDWETCKTCLVSPSKCTKTTLSD